MLRTALCSTVATPTRVGALGLGGMFLDVQVPEEGGSRDKRSLIVFSRIRRRVPRRVLFGVQTESRGDSWVWMGVYEPFTRAICCSKRPQLCM